MRRRRFLFVHNPIAGIDGRRLVHEVSAGLTHLGASVIRHDGDPQSLATLLTAEAGSIDAVVAAGGDGTIRALAAHIAPFGLPVGVVPMGTGNVLAHEIDLPRSAVGIVNVLLNGPVREFEGARANGEPFFLMAGVGFDGEVIRKLDTPLKRRVGKAAYVGPVLKTLRTAQPVLDVTVDGTAHRAHWLVAANAHRYGGPFIIAPEAGLERPGLVAVVVEASGAITQLGQLLALGIGRLHRARGVKMIPCRHITVQSVAPVSSQIDGDPFTTTPMTIEAGGISVRLIVPEAFAARLAVSEAAGAT